MHPAGPFTLRMTLLLLAGTSAAAGYKIPVTKSGLRTPVIGQGNPDITRHPVSRKQCREMLRQKGITYARPDFQKICGAPFMAPLYDPQKEKPTDARVCIDQFEFPSRPCEYPIVWVRASEAADLCRSEGKRLCDAHEWEGACAGSLQPPEYPFGTQSKLSDPDKVRARRQSHNRRHRPHKRWATGTRPPGKGVCAMDSFKSKGCTGGSWKKCGSNTYPSGYFPECRSPLHVYDQHGNAAEHMNLPVHRDEMASTGNKLGHTEMKGSWFIFGTYHAHQDWCRWRAPYWHGSRVRSDHSHRNYHLGFRCCKSLKGNP